MKYGNEQYKKQQFKLAPDPLNCGFHSLMGRLYNCNTSVLSRTKSAIILAKQNGYAFYIERNELYMNELKGIINRSDFDIKKILHAIDNRPSYSRWFIKSMKLFPVKTPPLEGEP